MKSIVSTISFIFLLSFLHAEDVKLSYRGGVYHIPVTLNGSVRLEFIVDSGAATLYMPNDVFRTLIRTGTIQKSDILREGRSETATGEIVNNLIVNIRQLQVGNQTIYNIEAAIGGENASLLLGQSALKKLEPWSLNTKKKILTIKSRNSYEAQYSQSSQSITRNQILSFIDKYISRGNSRDLDGVIALYSQRVNYFRAGVVSKNFIYNDKVKYYKRWPSIQVSFIGIDDIKNVRGHSNEKIVTYSIDFDVYNYSKRKGIKGQAINTVILKNEDGTLKIISDKQKVLNRKKY